MVLSKSTFCFLQGPGKDEHLLWDTKLLYDMKYPPITGDSQSHESGHAWQHSIISWKWDIQAWA